MSVTGEAYAEHPLWREAIANPDDLEIRGVLADALQAADDPRGELMSLQLLPADPEEAPARRARIRELVTRHHREWLGNAVGIASGAKFDRGFVTRLDLTSNTWADDDPRWSSLVPLLAQVRELGTSMARRGAAYGVSDTCDRILANRRLVNLRAIELDNRELARRESIADSVEHVAIMLAAGSGEPELHPWLGSRDRITELTVAEDVFHRLRSQPWFDRLRRVTIVGTVRRVLAIRPQLPAHMELGCISRTGLDTCELRFPADYAVVVRRDGTARISGEWTLHPLDTLAALPADVTRLEIEDTSETIVDRIRTIVRARDLEIHVLGEDGRAGNVRFP